MLDETGRYMVLVEDDGATNVPAVDVSRKEAWRVTRELQLASTLVEEHDMHDRFAA